MVDIREGKDTKMVSLINKKKQECLELEEIQITD
jgi:hypothetical protein